MNVAGYEVNDNGKINSIVNIFTITVTRITVIGYSEYQRRNKFYL